MRTTPRRILGLVVAFSLLVSVVGLAASQTFINKTGKTVAGITVTFSKRVMITRHDSVFRDQSPIGRSDQFTFSGGTLHSLARFNLSWTPSSAEIVDYQWKTTLLSTASVSQHIEQSSFQVTLTSDDGREIEVQLIRKQSDRMIPFSVEYEAQDGEGLTFTWDLNHLVDSDLDGQFRNDADAGGQKATMIYSTNRTPYTITLWARNETGAVYRGEDKISFNAQDGDEVLLNAEGFLPGATGIEWSSFNGDPKDTNIRISSPTQSLTTLTSTYPDVTTVSLQTTDSSGNAEQFDTTLYVFNKHPEWFKYRGMGVSVVWNKDFAYLARNLDSLKGIGVNYVKYPIYWGYSIGSDGYYVIHNSGKEDPTDDTFLSQMISLAHQRDFAVELHLVVDPDPGVTTDRNNAPMSDKFFEGPQGYFTYLQHYIDFANKNKVEVLVGKTEMSCTDFPEARPWMDKLIGMMGAGLINTRYTVESFFGQWANPVPWGSDYGVDLSKLDMVNWSAWHMKVGPYAGASIQEIMNSFSIYVLRPFLNTHNRYPNLKQVIGEFGFSSAKGGESSMSPGYDESILDYDAQKKGYAAVLRSLLDFINSGNSYFEGLFPHIYRVTRAMDSTKIVTQGDLFNKPALEEIYAFYSSEPQELPNIPIYCLWGRGRTQFYIDPYQDVKVIGPSDEIVQDFKGYGSPLTGPGVTTVPTITNVSARTSGAEAYKGDQSLQIHFETPIGDVPHQAPYARGGEAVVDTKVSVPSWDGIDSISLAVKRDDPNLGIVLLLFQGHNYEVAYSQRLPLNKVGEWEEIGVPLENFSRILGTGAITVGDFNSRNNFLPGEVGIALYSIDGSPVDTDVYLDSIAISRSPED